MRVLQWLRAKPTTKPTMPYVIVGIGNPGDRYTRTKHNVGFRVIDALCNQLNISLRDKRKHVILGEGWSGTDWLVLAKPRTFVNLSGAAAKYLRDRFRTPATRILVITDDLDLPLGSFRLRAGGGSGGHNGLKSITAELGTDAYPRIRIGIGRPANDAIEHVLSEFSKEEDEALSSVVVKVLEATLVWIDHGIDTAMNEFN